MLEKFRYKNKYGRTTVLTLNVLYTLSIVTFLYSIYCYFHLNIKGVLFSALLIYSIVNLLNILYFFKHKRILLTYKISSFLGFLIATILSFYSGGINSPVISFLVLLIFFGYLIDKFFGNLWLIIVTITVGFFYIIDVLDYKIINEISQDINSEFNLIFLLFLIILLGGVFGRMMNKTNEKIKQAKLEIVHKNDEKSIMLREIHHRVKNNLQIVNSLLRIQSRGVKDDSVKSMFKIAQSRVVAMARLHEKIYNTKDFKHIDINEYVKLLVSDLIYSYNLDKEITSVLTIEPLKISIDALLPLSLIINEFVSNSLKHAFTYMDKGEIVVELKSLSDNKYELIIGDNGKGFQNNNSSTAPNSTGLILINTFVKQLKGNLEQLDSKVGVLFKISFSDIEV